MSDEWNEKRRIRSEQPSEAIRLQLEYLFQTGKLRNYTLVDESGLVVSMAGDMADSNAVAAYAPLIARGDEATRASLISDLERTIPNFVPEHFVVREFDINGQVVFLVIFGNESTPTEELISHAVQGIKRIMRTTSAFEGG